MKINIYNWQKDLRLNQKHVKNQVKAILNLEKICTDEISIYFVDEKKIRALHKEFFNDPSTTDTISFPIDTPESGCNLHTILGEVFVCPKTAINYARLHNKNPFDETTLYLVHGLLHLLGYDDQEEKENKRMRKKEKYCMNFLKKALLGICKKHTTYWKSLNE